MSDLRGRTFSNLVAGLNAGQHLAIDAVVAFVDGELSTGAQERAAEHLATCRTCAAEVAGQRQARSVVRSADGPQIPAGLLATLRAIPHTTELPGGSDGLAVTGQGTVVTIPDPARTAPLGAGTPFGGSPPLGTGSRWGIGPSILGRRIGRTGASVVVSGLVLGVLIMTIVEEPTAGMAGQQPRVPASPIPAPVFEPESSNPSVVPAVATVTRADTNDALLRMTTAQPGLSSLHVRR